MFVDSKLYVLDVDVFLFIINCWVINSVLKDDEVLNVIFIG